MDVENVFRRKYRLATAILSQVADCANGKLVLVGGTALAVFHLNHRVSVDLDFVPVSGDEIKEKESLKGCLSKKGFVTQRARHSNQFVVQSETTSVKIEIFTPDEKIAKIERHSIGGNAILVASLDDLLKMKSKAYSERKKDRDLFDVVAILRKQGGSLDFAMQLVAKYGKPEDIKELEEMSPDSAVFEKFREVLE